MEKRTSREGPRSATSVRESGEKSSPEKNPGPLKQEAPYELRFNDTRGGVGMAGEYTDLMLPRR
jgi:hypothetical protein